MTDSQWRYLGVLFVRGLFSFGRAVLTFAVFIIAAKFFVFLGISKAPRDGSDILVFDKDAGTQHVVKWSPPSWIREGDDYDLVVYADYWQPLPSPPEGESK